MNLAVIIPAAGASSRYSAGGGVRPKIDEDMGGRPVLQRTVELFNALDCVSAIIVAGPDEAYPEFLTRHGDKLGLLGVRVCRGGKSHRYETVKNALALVPEDCTHIAVHDAARPCASEALIERVLAAAEKHPAVIPAIEVPDTLKRVEAAAVVDKDIDPLDAILGGAGRDRSKVRRVVETVSRERLVLVQTPQVFEAGLLRRAYEQPDLSSTDDAGLVERLGEPVVVVEGDPRNIKITRPPDLEMARKILGVKPPEGRAVHKRF
ncbi:MAG TPA: 2-C-methyl-D-erythritol 4-phosphate cytidylyltransferase [Phycisphaerales bacterium]|nr:2-C-methyl-D-erythritol 4-phosphate cytidylyltransferase [Phycisphaerales bacterium]